MNPDRLTAPIDGQTRILEMAAEAVGRGDLAAEQFLRMLTVEVGQTESEAVYTENSLELHRYEPETRRHETPILIVYALVNRPYILDLQPDRSVIRRLLEAGFPVYLVDWGEPSRLDAHLGMTDYVCRYLDNCVDATLADADAADLHVLGYCMGGTMSLMYASRNPDPLRTLTCMATPVTFEGDGGVLERWAEHFDPGQAVGTLGNIPGDVLAVEFSMMDPVEHYVTKYVRLCENIEDDEFVENFARMERWIWDGVDVAGRAFREFVDDVYRDNQLAAGEFTLDGEPVDLSTVDLPLCQIVGEYDHVVPAASSRPLVDLVGSTDERLIEFPAGHVGISVSSKAHATLWPTVTDWLAERSDPVAGTGGGTAAAGRSAPSSPPTAADELDSAIAEPADDRERARQTVESVARRAAGKVAAERVGAEVRSGGDGTADSAPVAEIDGIGSTYADRLAAAGIETVGDLRQRGAQELADLADAPTGRAENWLDRAG